MNWTQIFTSAARGNTLAAKLITDHYDNDQLGILTTLDEDLPRHGNGEPVDSVMYLLYTELVDLIANQQWAFLADKYRELVAYTGQALSDYADELRAGRELESTEWSDLNYGRL